MATPGALNAFAATGENPINYIVRHMNLDPGSLGAEDQLHNLRAVRAGTRVFADYYNRTRTHLSLTKDSPESRTMQRPSQGRW